MVQNLFNNTSSIRSPISDKISSRRFFSSSVMATTLLASAASWKRQKNKVKYNSCTYYFFSFQSFILSSLHFILLNRFLPLFWYHFINLILMLYSDSTYQNIPFDKVFLFHFSFFLIVFMSCLCLLLASLSVARFILAFSTWRIISFEESKHQLLTT